MAGKVAEIKQMLARENLARQLGHLYNNWWIQRQDKEEEWRELRNYLFATDTTKTTNSKLPWKNKTTLPKLTQIRDNLHANYMDALFPNDNWMKWEGASLEDTTKSIPDWLIGAPYHSRKPNILAAVEDMSFEHGSYQEMKEIWDKSKEIRLFKLYDKVHNALDLDKWMRPERQRIYKEYVRTLTQDVETNYGELAIMRIAQGIIES